MEIGKGVMSLGICGVTMYLSHLRPDYGLLYFIILMFLLFFMWVEE